MCKVKEWQYGQLDATNVATTPSLGHGNNLGYGANHDKMNAALQQTSDSYGTIVHSDVLGTIIQGTPEQLARSSEIPQTIQIPMKGQGVPTTEGLKFDNEKPDLSLLSSIAMIEVGKVMTFGKKKYSANNWRGGIAWTRLIAAALRHIFAFSGGESLDPETGLSHLAHAMCCLMMLVEFQTTRIELDDRFVQAREGK